jgi:outer membrane biosynthesis protein TonB
VRGVILSIFVHAGIVAAGLIYLPRASHLLENTPIVPVELVTLAERTSVRAAAPEPEPEVEDIPEETIEDAIAEPETQAPEPTPEPDPVVPEPITPEPVTQPDPEPEPEEPEPETPPQPDPPRQEPPREPSLEDFLGDISNQLPPRSSNPQEQGEQRDSAGDGERMTATLRDMIASHLSRCWRNSLDAPEPDELSVRLILDLRRNGELAGPPRIVDQGRVLNSSNPYLRVAGERALRAAVQCQPYPLPPEAYSQWRQIEVNFSPELYNR